MSSPLSFILFIFFQFLFSSSFCSLSNSTHEVIIIGAGPSGIAAFSVLAKNKTDVIILEAENRIGGRINTVEFGENVVDLGAQWVHGSKHIGYKLANDFGLITKSNFSLINYCYSNRKEIPNDLIVKFQEISMEILKCQDIQEELTVAEFATEKFKNLTSDLKVPEEFPNLLEDMLENLMHNYIAGLSAFDWNQPSARSDNEDCDENNYNWKGKGYKTILNVLLDKTPYGSDNFEPEKKILLNKNVIKINSNNSEGIVKIYCNDSTEYKAKRVIFTPSLGVLKAKMNMFHPDLPDHKQRAIKSLGIGGVAKVFLEYSNDWFNNHGKFDVLDLIWDKNLRKSLKNFTTDEGVPWITDLAAILSVDYNPNLLYLWFDGQTIPFIENLSEEDLMDGIQFALNQFFGHKFEIPKPINILRSKWYTNENFLGTYSYQTIESRKQPSNKHLGEPLQDQYGKDVIFFAGEATSLDHFSTVHGAIQSGFREADNVLKSL
nr:probable polyamine oxidase 5 [Onthophagus taurus]